MPGFAPLVLLALAVTLSMQGTLEVFADLRLRGQKDLAFSTVAASVLTSALALAFVTLDALVASLILALGLALFFALRQLLRREMAAGLAAICLLIYVHLVTAGAATVSL